MCGHLCVCVSVVISVWLLPCWHKVMRLWRQFHLWPWGWSSDRNRNKCCFEKSLFSVTVALGSDAAADINTSLHTTGFRQSHFYFLANENFTMFQFHWKLHSTPSKPNMKCSKFVQLLRRRISTAEDQIKGTLRLHKWVLVIFTIYVCNMTSAF